MSRNMCYHMFIGPFDCVHASVGAAMHHHSLRLSDPDLTALNEPV